MSIESWKCLFGRYLEQEIYILNITNLVRAPWKNESSSAHSQNLSDLLLSFPDTLEIGKIDNRKGRVVRQSYYLVCSHLHSSSSLIGNKRKGHLPPNWFYDLVIMFTWTSFYSVQGPFSESLICQNSILVTRAIKNYEELEILLASK